MKIQEIFINNLKSFRKAAGLTQAQLATYIDKSFNYINGIECGVSFPPPDVIDKISDVLKIKPSQLFSETDCIKNIIDSDKNYFINQISDSVYNKLKDKIKNDISEAVKSSISF